MRIIVDIVGAIRDIHIFINKKSRVMNNKHIEN